MSRSRDYPGCSAIAKQSRFFGDWATHSPNKTADFFIPNRGKKIANDVWKATSRSFINIDHLYYIFIYEHLYEHLLTSPLKKPQEPCSDWSFLLILREAIKAPYEARSIETHCSGGAALFDGTKTVAGCPQKLDVEKWKLIQVAPNTPSTLEMARLLEVKLETCSPLVAANYPYKMGGSNPVIANVLHKQT